MQRRALVPSALAALTLLSACGESSTGAEASALSRAEIEAIAPSLGEMSGLILDGQWGFDGAAGAEVAAEPATRTRTFSATRSCPKGGSVTLAGTATATVDPATRSGTFQSTATRTEAACAHEGRAGATVTVNGNPNTVIAGSHSVTNGAPGTRTLTQKGAFTWARSTGQRGACAIDVTSTWDPAARTHTVTGTVCGHAVNVSRPRG